MDTRRIAPYAPGLPALWPWNRPARRSWAAAALCAVAVSCALTSCSTAAPVGDQVATGEQRPAEFPSGAAPDYQLGGAYAPAQAVGIVARDRSAAPDPERYSICYINGFQTQPGELETWDASTLLTDANGPVIDPDWPDEVLLNTASEASRTRILEVVTPWIEGCAADGFDAVEFDNLDTYTRSSGALNREGNVALATAYVAVAHAAGLSAGQKNAAEDARVLQASAGFDFAVSEECAAYDECEAYTSVYGDAVIDIEYSDELPRPFAEMCRDPRTPKSVVMRDRDLSEPGDAAYVFELCPNK